MLNLNNSEELLIFKMAFRYALTRQTYVVSSMVSIIENNWGVLDEGTKLMITHEIQSTLEMFPETEDYVKREWNKILNLKG